MPRPPGRPRTETPTELIPVRIRTADRARLDFHLDWLEQEHGLRASRSGVIARALRAYLDDQEAKHYGSSAASVEAATNVLTPADVARLAVSAAEHVLQDDPAIEETSTEILENGLCIQKNTEVYEQASTLEATEETTPRSGQHKRYGEDTAKVLAILTHLGQATCADIAKALGAETPADMQKLTKAAYQALGRLVKQRKVRKEGRTYRPVG